MNRKDSAFVLNTFPFIFSIPLHCKSLPAVFSLFLPTAMYIKVNNTKDTKYHL